MDDESEEACGCVVCSRTVPKSLICVDMDTHELLCPGTCDAATRESNSPPPFFCTAPRVACRAPDARKIAKCCGRNAVHYRQRHFQRVLEQRKLDKRWSPAVARPTPDAATSPAPKELPPRSPTEPSTPANHQRITSPTTTGVSFADAVAGSQADVVTTAAADADDADDDDAVCGDTTAQPLLLTRRQPWRRWVARHAARDAARDARARGVRRHV